MPRQVTETEMLKRVEALRRRDARWYALQERIFWRAALIALVEIAEEEEYEREAYAEYAEYGVGSF
jgi:hypothetical protein